MDKQYLINLGLCKDNKWLDKYVELVHNNKAREHEVWRTQCHHIVPQYYFNSLELDVDNSVDNLVNLLYKDHIRAHYYLMLCSSTIQYKSYNILAMRKIFGDTFTQETDIEDFDLDVYQAQYEMCKDYIYELTHTLDACRKISESLTGRVSPVKGKKWGKPRKSRKNANPKNKLLSDLASQRVGEKNSFYHHTHSEKTKKILSEKKSIPVIMLDYNTKEEIMRFKSAKDAALYLVSVGITTNKTSGGSRILNVCNEGDLKYHAYGYSWKFANKV